MKHTAGPWKIGEEGYIESQFGLVAQVVGADSPDDETIPNARLITAAPELLDELKSVLEWIQTGKVEGVGFCEATIADAIRSAIAKAEGRA